MEKSKKLYKSVSNWIMIILSVILVPILVINIYIMIQSKTNEDVVPSVFGIKPFIVLSGSMESEIFKGDLILTKTVDPDTLKVKDVIAFRDAEGTVTTHRIIDIVENDGVTYYITKGDNNDSQDQNLVEKTDIEGKYIMRIPGIGSIMNTLAEPTTVLILVLCITVAFVIGFVITNKKETQKEREEFLEYKRMKELEEKNKKKLEENDAVKEVKEKEVVKKKTTSKKKVSKK